jgi:hypothetical protein
MTPSGAPPDREKDQRGDHNLADDVNKDAVEQRIGSFAVSSGSPWDLRANLSIICSWLTTWAFCPQRMTHSWREQWLRSSEC